MTDRAQPGAIDSLVRNYELGDALGQFSDGWVVPADEPTASAQRSDLDETAFTAFDQTSSSSSLTVTIGPGEAFVDGWLATDTSTDVTLAASTAGQTVGVSWDPDAVYDPDTDADRDAADRVIVGLEGDVSSVDPFLPLWTFDTDGSGVTSTTDERTLGPSVDPEHLAGADIPAAPPGEFLRKSTDGLEFAEIVAGATVQDTEPSNPTEGEFWYDTVEGVLYVYGETDGLTRWYAIPNVQVLEEASTFSEPDVSLSITDSLKVENDSVVIKDSGNPQSLDDFEDNDLTVTGDNWSGWVQDYGDLKVITDALSGGYSARLTKTSRSYSRATATRNAEIQFQRADVKLRIPQSTGDGSEYVSVELQDSSSNILKPQFYFDGSTNFGFTWNTSTIYDVSIRNIDFSAGSSDLYINGTFQGNVGHSLNGIKKIVIKVSANDGYSAEFDDVVTYEKPSQNGNVLLAWDSGSPPDIESWDLATYQRTLDNETVTVDVEDGSGNVLFSDIDQNFDISTVDTSKNVKLRAYLSRNDTANNPTLDYAARRFSQ